MNMFANHLCDGQTAITHRMAEMVHIPSDHLLGVWPSGVNLHRFASEGSKRCWPKSGETVRLIYIGALHFERNILGLCRAVEKANAKGMKFEFVIFGTGTAKNELEQFAAFTEGRIQIFPPVPHKNVPELLSNAHVGTLPFPDEEKFRVSSPIKLFEYMASGLPILATKIACHTDVIGNKEFVFWAGNAAVSGLEDALDELWMSRNQLETLSGLVSTEAVKWTWTQSGQKLSNALESLYRKNFEENTIS